MTESPSSLDTIAVPSPDVPEKEVLDLLIREYGLRGNLTQLVSERDQNFRVDTTDGRQFVVKIANSAEPTQITDFQIQALLHLEASACTVAVPRLIRTRTGAMTSNIQTSDASNVLRVVSYVPGRPVEGTVPGPGLAYALGQCLAKLDLALSDFSHAGESQVLLWDMQRASELRDLMTHISDPELRSTDDDALAETQALVAGFDSIVPLEDRECELLFDLIRMCLATTITILHWRKSARSEEDAYLKKALRERSSEHFLRTINGIARRGFADRVLISKNSD
jgi:Ser/Thr protein kinase RdoA (MazF antagonist)